MFKILLKIVYYPIISILSIVLGIFAGLIGKLIGNTEDLIANIKHDFVGEKLYPNDRAKRYYESALKTKEMSGNSRGASELRDLYEFGQFKAPRPYVSSIITTGLYLVILPFSLLSGLIEGVIRIFELFNDYWNLKIEKNFSEMDEKINNLYKENLDKIKSKKPLVLVIEDHEGQALKIANIICDSEKYNPIVVNNGMEGIKFFKKCQRYLGFARNKIKCIVLDIKMPVMDGLQFLKVLREQERFESSSRYCPVVMLTAYEDQEKLMSTSNPVVGLAAAYIKKPVDDVQLIKILDSILINNETDFMIDENKEVSSEKVKKLMEEAIQENLKINSEEKTIQN